MPRNQFSEFDMAMMTEEAAGILDEELTRTTPAVNSRIRGIIAKALAARQTLEEVIRALVEFELTQSV